MGEVPIINNFDEGGGKFIQVCVNNDIYFWVGSSRLLHGHIFNKLLNSLKVSYDTFEESFEGELINIPKIEGENYSLIGAGKFKILEGKYFLSGKSGSYLISPHEGHAKEISKITGLEFIIE